MVNKFVILTSFLSVFGIAGFVDVNAERGKEKKIEYNIERDSLIVYQAKEDSLKAELIDADSLNIKKEEVAISSKRMESALDDEKTPVHPTDLPTAIKSTLSDGEFKEWKTTAVNFVKPKKGNSYYEIALLRDSNMRIAKFNGNGKVL